MVFTLHRYIFREVFRVFVLAAVALTLILSLGSILRPIQEYGVGPRQVVYLIGFFLPITLTFVLPMAALFATTLVYGRFAADNELDACRASGVSLMTLVYPGLTLAIMVAIANLILSFHVMPAFVHNAEKSLKADAKQILFRNIQQRGYYKPPGTDSRIYADYANAENDSLTGVIVANVKEARIEKLITAESATVRFNPHETFNEVLITTNNPYQMASEDLTGFSAESMVLTLEFPPLLGDDVKFKKIREMKKIKVEPVLFYPIEKLARRTYAQFTAELLAQDIRDGINPAPIVPESNSETKTPARGQLVRGFYNLHSDKKIVEFTATQCTTSEEKKVQLSGDVVATEYDAISKQMLRELHCTKALIDIEGDELAPTLTLTLFNATWQRPDGSTGLDRRPVIRGLILPTTVTDTFKTPDLLDSVRDGFIASALKTKPGSALNSLQQKLKAKIRDTLAQIQAEVHSRLVFGIGCIPMIMIGIALGIIKKQGHLLSAFGASSIPAALLVVCIMMGKNIAKNPGSKTLSGILLMWMGLVVLSILAGGIYRKLLKN
ncbi:MAG: LptF/LptG family permease [Sedimentisphaerales bacterium]|nr:LptF/LptG family permease [Sedimentisphaerales bacterium]